MLISDNIDFKQRMCNQVQRLVKGLEWWLVVKSTCCSTEYSGSIPSTHVVAHRYLQLQFWGIQPLLLAFTSPARMRCTDTHTYKIKKLKDTSNCIMSKESVKEDYVVSRIYMNSVTKAQTISNKNGTELSRAKNISKNFCWRIQALPTSNVE